MNTVIVAAGICIERIEGAKRVLLTQRKKGAHLAGKWEFPGGKVESGEDPRAALVRELKEELGIETTIGEVVDVEFHRYDDVGKAILLLFFEAKRTLGSAPPRAIDVAAFTWGDAGALVADQFPAADLAVLAKVKRALLG